MRERTKSCRCFAASYSAFSDRSPCAAAVCQLLRELDGELVLQIGQLLLELREDGQFHGGASAGGGLGQDLARQLAGRLAIEAARRSAPAAPLITAPSCRALPAASGVADRAAPARRRRAAPARSSPGWRARPGSASTRSSRPAFTANSSASSRLRTSRRTPGRDRLPRAAAPRRSTLRCLAAATTPRRTSTRCVSRAFIAAVRSWASCSSVSATRCKVEGAPGVVKPARPRLRRPAPSRTVERVPPGTGVA